jgi:hypothetical protein
MMEPVIESEEGPVRQDMIEMESIADICGKPVCRELFKGIEMCKGVNNIGRRQDYNESIVYRMNSIIGILES